MDLQVFKNHEFGQVRTILHDNQIWFIASDIAKVLQYRDAYNMTRILDDDEKDTHLMSTPSSKQCLTIINESGLYSCILRSKKDNAKKFKKWVTSVVLPSIRKNGGYIANQENLDEETLMAKALQVAQNVIDRKNKEIETMTPKAKYFDSLVERNLLTNFRDTAKEFGLGQNKFIEWLLQNSYIYRDKRRKLKPYSQYVPELFELKEWANSERAGTQTLITPKGRETFRLLIKEG